MNINSRKCKMSSHQFTSTTINQSHVFQSSGHSPLFVGTQDSLQHLTIDLGFPPESCDNHAFLGPRISFHQRLTAQTQDSLSPVSRDRPGILFTSASRQTWDFHQRFAIIMLFSDLEFAFTSVSLSRHGIHFHQCLLIHFLVQIQDSLLPAFSYQHIPRFDLGITSPTFTYSYLGFSSPASRVEPEISTNVLRQINPYHIIQSL